MWQYNTFGMESLLLGGIHVFIVVRCAGMPMLSGYWGVN